MKIHEITEASKTNLIVLARKHGFTVELNLM